MATVLLLATLAGCSSGSGDEAVPTTTTSSPAPAWLRREISQQSQAAGGPRHGTGHVVPFTSRQAAVAAVSTDRVVNVEDPPVYVVVLRGRFTSDRGTITGQTPHAPQLTLVVPQKASGVTVLDSGIGPTTPFPPGAQPFTF